MASEPDVAIIGGGILGLIVACLTARKGLRTVLFRMSDSRTPHADTLRNQSWLQSGLRYVRVNKVLAEMMRTHGHRMLEFFGIQPPNGRGVLQVASNDEAQRVYDDAVELGVRADIRELHFDEARALLGALHNEQGVAFETPESPFDEATLLVEAREAARLWRAEFRQVVRPVELMPFPQRSPSYRLRVEGKELEAGTTVLAAGSGNLPLLRMLNSSLTLELTQTPLLVVPGKPLIQSPILLDRSAGLSIVAHAPGTSRRDGCMVIGTDVKEPQPHYCEADRRKVTDGARSTLLGSLPKCVSERLSKARFTAAWEPIPVRNGKRLSSLEPCVQPVDGHPDVILSTPGRATLALRAAEIVMEQLSTHGFQNPRNTDIWDPNIPGEAWDRNSSIHMHHEEYYDELNDI
jgi:glycine/D-amino acid oxidase-like deaminating enzyme